MKTVLKRISGDPFVIDLVYATPDNAFYKDMYSEFGLNECLVRPELYDALMRLKPELTRRNLRLVIYDTWRPWLVQKYMYETAPDYLKPYIAPPPVEGANSGLHTRAAAIDCYLAGLEFPTLPDAFYPGYENDPNYAEYLKKAHRDFSGCENVKLLEGLMMGVGLEALPEEWWHFNLPDAGKYPILYSLDDIIVSD